MKKKHSGTSYNETTGIFFSPSHFVRNPTLWKERKSVMWEDRWSGKNIGMVFDDAVQRWEDREAMVL